MAAFRETLLGKKVLIVEDNWFIAEELTRDLIEGGFDVVGPVPTVKDALAAIYTQEVDGAVLDVTLRGGERAFAVADLLAERQIPFVLLTGYELDLIPESYRSAPRCDKPVRMDRLIALLFPLSKLSAFDPAG